MKTTAVLISIFMLLFTLVNAQTKPTTAKATTTKAVSVNTSCDDLKKENEFLKKSLKISEPVKVVEKDDLEIKLISAIGNIKTQTIKIEYLVTNKINIRHFYINAFYDQIISVEGEKIPVTRGYNSPDIELYTDVPMKITIEVGTILPSNTILKLITMKYELMNPNVKGIAEFRDIPVEWK